MYADKLMTQEEQEALVRRVWDEEKQSILKAVEYAIHTEMANSVLSMSKKLVQQELRALIAPMIEAKHAELQAAAEKIVERMAVKLEVTVLDEMKSAFASVYDDRNSHMFSELQYRLRSAMEKVLTYDSKTEKYVEKTDPENDKHS